MIIGTIYLIGLILCAIFMYAMDERAFRHQPNIVFLVMYPAVFMYIGFLCMILLLDTIFVE